MTRNRKHQPTTEGTWTKVASKTYQHISGAVVAYDHNHFCWTIQGDGRSYPTLWLAQMVAEG